MILYSITPLTEELLVQSAQHDNMVKCEVWD
jgi:hypothetical protein